MREEDNAVPDGYALWCTGNRICHYNITTRNYVMYWKEAIAL